MVLFLGSTPGISAARGILPESVRVSPMPVSGIRAHGVNRARDRGSRLVPPTAPLQAAGASKLQPLSQKQLLDLITAGVSSQRAAELVRDRGIDFEVDDDYVRTLRRAGATDLLIGVLRKTSVPMEGITVESEPNAQVFLDGSPQGLADARGVLVFRSKIGPHALKVSLAGKHDFEQSVTIVDGQPARVMAPLADIAGSIRVKAPAGASVWLDNSIRGTVDSGGEFLLSGISPGVHALRVTARGAVDDSQSVVVVAGTEKRMEVALADAVRANPQDELKYVWIAPGDFMMGCSPGDNDCSAPEKPAHRVTLPNAYWMGQTEVTVAAYKHFVEATKAQMPPAAPKLYRGWANGTLPMVNVIWNEARQYCAWAGGRLPTEAEWEYAARGGSPQARYGTLNEIAWSKENAGNQTHSVATKLANGYGLYDVLGNVWEWVNDWYDPNYYQSAPALNSSGPATGQEKVLRGGGLDCRPQIASGFRPLQYQARLPFGLLRFSMRVGAENSLKASSPNFSPCWNIFADQPKGGRRHLRREV